MSTRVKQLARGLPVRTWEGIGSRLGIFFRLKSRKSTFKFFFLLKSELSPHSPRGSSSKGPGIYDRNLVSSCSNNPKTTNSRHIGPYFSRHTKWWISQAIIQSYGGGWWSYDEIFSSCTYWLLHAQFSPCRSLFQTIDFSEFLTGKSSAGGWLGPKSCPNAKKKPKSAQQATTPTTQEGISYGTTVKRIYILARQSFLKQEKPRPSTSTVQYSSKDTPQINGFGLNNKIF